MTTTTDTTKSCVASGRHSETAALRGRVAISSGTARSRCRRGSEYVFARDGDRVKAVVFCSWRSALYFRGDNPILEMLQHHTRVDRYPRYRCVIGDVAEAFGNCSHAVMMVHEVEFLLERLVAERWELVAEVQRSKQRRSRRCKGK